MFTIAEACQPDLKVFLVGLWLWRGLLCEFRWLRIGDRGLEYKRTWVERASLK